MRWGSYRMRFIRPIRWIVSLWNDEVVPVKLEMVEAGNETRGTSIFEFRKKRT